MPAWWLMKRRNNRPAVRSPYSENGFRARRPSTRAPAGPAIRAGVNLRPLLHFLSLFLVLLSFARPAFSQEKGNVYLTGDRLNIRSLRGDDTVVDVYGNVRFLEREREVFASGRRAMWREVTGILRMTGNAAVYRDGTWIHGRTAKLDTESGTMVFPAGVLVVEENRTILANHGRFLTGSGDAESDTTVFSGDVAVLDSTRRVRADTLIFYAGEEEGFASGNVSLELYRENYEVLGEHAWFSEDRIVVTGEPSLVEKDSIGLVIGVLEGDTITLQTEGERIVAVGSTTGRYHGVRTSADTTIMGAESHVVFLFGSPRLARDDEAMTGDSIRIRFTEDDEEIDSVIVSGNASLVSEKSDSISVEKGNTTGDRMVLLFEESDLYRVEVTGSAVSDRFVENRAEEKREKSHAEGDTILYYMKDEELNRISVRSAAAGTNLSVPIDTPEEEESFEEARYRGDLIDFHMDRDVVILDGNAHVEQKEMCLDARKIRYDLDRGVVTAMGEPVLVDGEDRMDGKRMVYNINHGKGTIYDGMTSYESGICYGEEIVRTSQNTLLINRGRYTSCDDEHPHYYFRADHMKIYMNDKTVVAPIILYIADVPLLALPYYLFPLKGGRASGFILPMVEFGFSESKGRFIRNGGYFWAINDYADLTFRGDFYQNSHWVAYLNGRYRVRYLLSGSVRSSYKSSQDGRKRWSVQASHNHDITDNLDLTMRANFVSDKQYRVEESTKLEDLDRTLKSDLVLKQRWKNQSLSVQLTRTERLDQDRISQTLPSASYSLNRREVFPPASSGRGEKTERMWYNNIYFQYNTKLLNSREEDEGERDDHAGWDHKLAFNFSDKYGGWLGYSSRMNWHETWYDKDKIGQKAVRRGMGDASVSMNTNVYGTFFPRIGPLIGLRHIISPSASFSVTPKNPNHFYVDSTGVEKDRFYNFGGFGGSKRSRRSMSFRISNKLQTKYKMGEEIKKNDQLFLLNNSIGYDFEKDRDQGEEPFSPLSSSLRFQPVRAFNSELSLSHNVYSRAFTSLTVRSGMNFAGTLGTGSGMDGLSDGGIGDEYAEEGEWGRADEKSPFDDQETTPLSGSERSGTMRGHDSSSIPWTARFSHSFSRGASRSNFSQWLNANLGVGLTAGWEVSYENRYDLMDREIVSQGFRIHRDLHCWEASFRGRYSGREWEYYFNIRVRAHKELYYEMGERRLGY